MRTDFGSDADSAFGMAVQADGKIVAAGVGSDDTAFARYNADGSLDARFGNGGTLAMDLGGWDAASAVAQQTDGRIVASSTVTGSADFTLVRLKPNGSLDESFGSDGKVTTDFASRVDFAADLAVQGDGRIVAAGSSSLAGSSDFALARYQSDGVLAVSIDIKPGSRVNRIKLSSRGVVRVAVLSTAGFDATTVDPTSVCFGDDDSPSERDCTAAHGRGQVKDVNRDRRPDLVLRYEVGQTGIDAGDRIACLTGRTTAGVSIAGCDSIATR